jgi:predicted Zn-dependent protease with MMP-like domain
MRDQPLPTKGDPEDRRRQEFDDLVANAIAGVPSPFAERLDSVAFVVEDEPLPGQQPPGQLLFGLYEGVPRTAWGADGAPLSNRITIFRRTHELAFPDPERRAQAVRATVFHEVAHHFGIDDARLIELEAQRRRR